MSTDPVTDGQEPDVVLTTNVPVPGPASMPSGVVPLDGMPVAEPADIVATARALLVTYQSTFIAAQAQYIHTRDVSQIIEAQHGFVIDLLAVLEHVSKSELGEVQEQIIALVMSKLQLVGVVA